jgi:hypothetical protein
MRQTFIAGAACLFVASVAGAQSPLAVAKEKAQRAASATSAHVEAEQRPNGPDPVSRVASAARAPSPTRAASTTSQEALNVVQSDTTGSPPVSIMREAFDYSTDGRRDPFFSLLSSNELRPAINDLRLTGILFDHGGGHSVATLRDLSNAQYRVTVGSTLGRMRVSAIKIKAVIFTIDEFGSTRLDSLVLGDSTKARGK